MEALGRAASRWSKKAKPVAERGCCLLPKRRTSGQAAWRHVREFGRFDLNGYFQLRPHERRPDQGGGL